MFVCGVLCTITFASPQTTNNEITETIDRLRSLLPNATTAADSLPIILDIYDVIESVSDDSIGEELYGVVMRSGDIDAIHEITRYLARYSMRNDSVLTILQENTMRLPDSPERDVTVTYIKMMKNINHVRFAPDDGTKEKMFGQFLRLAILSPPNDIYDHIVLLHSLCMYLSESSESELLEKYIDQLGELISSLPEEATQLKNMYYVQRANIYTNTEHPEKALEANRIILSLTDSLENVYAERGRKYRNFDDTRYSVYTSMLQNFQLLSQSEVEEIYRKIQEIIARNPTAAHSAKESMHPQIYYALANGKKKEALELLKRAIRLPYNNTKRRAFLHFMIDCAKSTGDRETLLWASTQYNELLEDYLKQRLQERYKELQITYDVYHMRERYNTLESDKELSEASASRKELGVAIIFLVALLSLIGVLLTLLYRLRKVTRTLERKNSELLVERNNLEQSKLELTEARDEAEKANAFKTTFISNFSREVTVPLQIINEYTRLIVDFVDSEHIEHIERFATLVKNNSELLNTMINDMLNLTDLRNGIISLHPEVISSDILCKTAIESVQHRAGESIKLVFSDSPDSRASMFVDHDRVLQIIINLLLTSFKLIGKGTVELSTIVHPEDGMIDFIVTSEGDNINREMAEGMFDVAGTDVQNKKGGGIGISISRTIAQLMGGKLYLAPSYAYGVKLVLSLPIRQPETTVTSD